tara:strand:+ start:203 stop:739 length:537 start_codon:yes stop_codon:yes gene_type:complete
MRGTKFLSSILTGTLVLGGVVTPIYATSKDHYETRQQQIFEETREEERKQTHCLALNVYYEARSSNLADKAAVADVVINRSLDRRYPATLCAVVEEGYIAGRKDCQFSWFCDGKSDDPVDLDRWNEAQTIAYSMLEYGQYRGITEGATHYHATYVDPYWADSLQMVGTIGAHVYYRWD